MLFTYGQWEGGKGWKPGSEAGGNSKEDGIRKDRNCILK